MKLNARILLVEDDAVMRTFVIGLLRELGIENVIACEDGTRALGSLAHFIPDLIMTDIHMQPMGGLDFVKNLRQASNPEMKRLKVLFMSADSSADTIREALPLGIIGYIVKPPKIESLRAKLVQAQIAVLQ